MRVLSLARCGQQLARIPCTKTSRDGCQLFPERVWSSGKGITLTTTSNLLHRGSTVPFLSLFFLIYRLVTANEVLDKLMQLQRAQGTRKALARKLMGMEIAYGG